MKYSFCTSFLICCLSSSLWAQSLKVVDRKTKLAVPFYHLFDFKREVVLLGSSDGENSLLEIYDAFSDTIFISHLGYETGRFVVSHISNPITDHVLELAPSFFDLDSVSAKVMDEGQLFREFQEKLKKELLGNSYLVRLHLWENIPSKDYFEENFALMGFGGIVERKGRNGSFDRGRSFFLSEASRKSKEYDRNELFTTKDLIGIVLNELLKEVRDVNTKSVIPTESSHENGKFTVQYNFKETGLQLVLSENGNLLKLFWKKGKYFHLPNSDAIRADFGEFRFYDNELVLVPISIDLEYEHLISKELRNVYALASFIPSPIAFEQFLTKNYKLEDYFRLLNLVETMTGFDSKNPFFQSNKAQYAIRQMEKFTSLTFKERNWVNISPSEILERSNDSSLKIQFEEIIHYRKELIGYYKSQGLVW